MTINDLLKYLDKITDMDDFNTREDQLKLTVIKDMLIELCRIKFNNNFDTKNLY